MTATVHPTCPLDACPRCEERYDLPPADNGRPHQRPMARLFTIEPVTWICCECGYVFDRTGQKRLHDAGVTF